MRKVLLYCLSVLVLLSSCGKGGSSDPKGAKTPDLTTTPPVVTPPVVTPPDGAATPENSVTINGTSYPTVKIGNSTWTSVNYNGPGGLNYNNTTNDPNYGKLYTIAEARAIGLPSGWKLPTQQHYEAMLMLYDYTRKYADISIGALTSEKLKSTSGWTQTNGVNSTGFNAYPAGTGYFIDGVQTFDDKGSETAFVTATTLDNQIVNFRIYSFLNTNKTTNNGGDIGSFLNSRNFRYSIRFVKDN